MKHRFFFGLGVWLFFLSTTFSQKTSFSEEELLRVGPYTISARDFFERVAENPALQEETLLILRTLMMEKLLDLETKKVGIFVNEKEKDTFVQKEKELLKKRIEVDLGKEYTLEKYLSSQGLTLQQFTLITREKVTKQLLLGKLIRYLQRQEERVEVLYMELGSRQEAEQVRKQLIQGTSFSTLARKHSKHPPSQKAGGKLPILSKAELGDLSIKVFALKPNETSEVLEYNKKFHLFQVLKFYAKELRPYADVNQTIFQELEQTGGVTSLEIDQWLVNALKKYPLNLKNPYLQKNTLIKQLVPQSEEKK